MTEKRHPQYLLTPGPLTTSLAVKKAMQFDKSSNGPEMVSLVRGIRDYIVELSHGGNTYECVPVQGSATYGIEAVFQTLTDKSKARVLVIENGYYGLRLREVLSEIGID